jgi:cytidine deaminase
LHACESLIVAATRARDQAIAAYSGFRVGAAVEASDGRVFTGCNVENASYGLTICAERVAIFKALSEGARSFRALAVVADTDRLTPPCGACRQIIWEFAGDIPIVLANLAGTTVVHRSGALLPHPFDGSIVPPRT